MTTSGNGPSPLGRYTTASSRKTSEPVAGVVIGTHHCCQLSGPIGAPAGPACGSANALVAATSRSSNTTNPAGTARCQDDDLVSGICDGINCFLGSKRCNAHA